MIFPILMDHEDNYMYAEILVKHVIKIVHEKWLRYNEHDFLWSLVFL